MDEKELLHLIENDESETIEFKKSTAQIEKALKAVCSFLNHKGGTVYFGIEKKKIVGQEVSDSTLKSISQKIRQRIKPEISPEIRVFEINGKKIIEVKINEGNNKLYYLDGIAYKRVGSENVIIPPNELKRIILDKKKYLDSEICENAGLEDIDEEKVRWFLGKARYERRLDIGPETDVAEALERLELAKEGKLTNAAILLFAKNPQKFFLQAETRCARFKGTEPIEFIDMKVFGKDIIGQRDSALEFVKEHTALHAKIVGTEREEKWEYPIEAIRESITNSICHRDYEVQSSIQVRIFDDRIEISNPGPLPVGLTVEKLKGRHESILRNPLLGKCFFLIKFVEQWGTGTNRIIKETINHGLPEPIFEDTGTGFIVTFRKYRITDEILGQLNERQRKAIEYLRTHEKITNPGYLKLNPNITDRTALNDLKELVRKGIIKASGEKKQRYYLLA